MGGHKKHKGQQSQSSGRKSQQQQQPAQSKHQLKQHKVDTQVSHSIKSEVEEKLNVPSFLKNTRKDILAVVFGATVLVVVAIIVVTVKSVRNSFQEPDDGVVVNAGRVTTLDHDIVSKNILLESELQHDNRKQKGQGNDSGSSFGSSVHSHVNIELKENTVHPTLCKDGVTMGFSDWSTLKAAVQEANALSAERFLRWNEYFASVEGQTFGAFEDGSLYYEEDVIFRICPGSTLKSRQGPIYINAENIIIECDFCVIDVRGTHLAFGPHAKNVMVRGITFRGAHTSSLTFYHDGAEASFEDCYWTGNVGNGKVGAVADVNSTSCVAFYRCEIADTKYVPRAGQGRAQSGVASSLTIRGS